LVSSLTSGVYSLLVILKTGKSFLQYSSQYYWLLG
jgi:hypothetical protein